MTRSHTFWAPPINGYPHALGTLQWLPNSWLPCQCVTDTNNVCCRRDVGVVRSPARLIVHTSHSWPARIIHQYCWNQFQKTFSLKKPSAQILNTVENYQMVKLEWSILNYDDLSNYFAISLHIIRK